MTKSATLYLIYIAFLVAACGSQDPQAIQQRVELKRFDSCSQLESYIKSVAIREMELRIDDSIESLRQWTWGPTGGADAGAMMSADGAAAPSPSQPGDKSADGPAAHTTTNTQVEDVDEPDFIKNDGKRILVLTNDQNGGRLYAAKSWPPSALSLAGSLSIEGHPTQMFLDGDRVVVFSYVSTQSLKSGGSCVGDYSCYQSYGNALKITVVSVKDLSKPVVVSEVLLPGRYRAARRVGSAVRIVLSDYFRWPEGVRFYPEYDPGRSYDDQEATIEAYHALKEKNRQLIASSDLGDWLQDGLRKLPDGSTVELGYSCSDFYKPNASVRLGMASVVSLDLDNLSAKPSRVSVIGGVDEIYANASSLYLAGYHWWWWSKPGQKDHTYLHKFDISDPRKARYVASGGVEGHLLDQFAMDEHKGYFRVATTVSWREESPDSTWGQTRTVNRVNVFREKAGRLELIGETKDLAEGEAIYSVRFQGDRGYVVTFRQVDPLYTLDLGKASAPRVVGQLKVPGFSTYIHPLDGNHLLTIGEHRADPDDPSNQGWNERRMKLTIFDVSNLAKPREKFTHLIGTANGWSDAQYEHKAFNYFAERKLLAIPFSDYTWDYSDGNYWDSFISEVRVFRIDLQKGISTVGALSMKDIYIQRNDHDWYGYYSPWVRRSVMATSTEGVDYVYAIADVGIRVAEAQALDTAIQTMLFQ